MLFSCLLWSSMCVCVHLKHLSDVIWCYLYIVHVLRMIQWSNAEYQKASKNNGCSKPAAWCISRLKGSDKAETDWWLRTSSNHHRLEMSHLKQWWKRKTEKLPSWSSCLASQCLAKPFLGCGIGTSCIFLCCCCNVGQQLAKKNLFSS